VGLGSEGGDEVRAVMEKKNKMKTKIREENCRRKNTPAVNNAGVTTRQRNYKAGATKCKDWAL